MKKCIIAALALSLVCCLCSCGSDSSTPQKIVVRSENAVSETKSVKQSEESSQASRKAEESYKTISETSQQSEESSESSEESSEQSEESSESSSESSEQSEENSESSQESSEQSEESSESSEESSEQSEESSESSEQSEESSEVSEEESSEDEESQESDENSSDEETETVSSDGIYYIDGAAYIDGIIIVNKTYSLPEDYGNGEDPEALSAFYEMQNDAYSDNIYLEIISGFRSYETQYYTYNSFVYDRGTELADRVSARPGHSEHQTGLAFDINTTANYFADTPEAAWLAEHCAEYGFIIRYPKDKEYVTGYAYEPWHIRYIGREKAKIMTQSGLTLEEYYGLTSYYS